MSHTRMKESSCRLNLMALRRGRSTTCVKSDIDRDTESASVSTLLITFAFVVPRKAESRGVVVGTVNVVVGLLWVVDIAF